MAMPWKAYRAALMAIRSIGGASLGECPANCEYFDDYEAFGDYLTDLTNCEKERLFPAMEARHRFISVKGKAIDTENEDKPTSRLEAIQRMQGIKQAYIVELRLLNAELVKTQELLFDDCTSENSREILAKHAQAVTHGIELHNEQLQALNEYLGNVNAN